MSKRINNDLSLPNTGFLRLSQILRFIPISKSTWWHWVSIGKAPMGIKLGANTTAWRAEDINQLLFDLAQSS